LKSVASKAKKSLKKVSGYFKTALEQAKRKKRAGEVTGEPEAYAMGVAKKRAGVEDTDLLVLGVSPHTVVEANILTPITERDPEIDTVEERRFMALTLRDLFMQERFRTPTPFFDPMGEPNPVFFQRLDEAKDGGSWKSWLAKVFPNVDPVYWEFLVQQMR
jgi:hypothetical protein